MLTRRNPKRGRKPGRPLVAGARRTEDVRVRVTPDEKRAISDRADASGLLVSDFVRWRLLGRRPK